MLRRRSFAARVTSNRGQPEANFRVDHDHVKRTLHVSGSELTRHWTDRDFTYDLRTKTVTEVSEYGTRGTHRPGDPFYGVTMQAMLDFLALAVNAAENDGEMWEGKKEEFSERNAFKVTKADQMSLIDREKLLKKRT